METVREYERMDKMKKAKKSSVCLILFLWVFLFTAIHHPIQVKAESASLSVSAPSNANMDESVTVTVNVSGETAAKYQLAINYDASVLQYVSSKNCSGGSGTLNLAMDTDSGSFSENITFKTIGAGNGTVSANVADSSKTNTAEKISMNTSAAATVAVNNAGSTSTSGNNESTGGTDNTNAANLSSDNSLKSLSLSSGSLSPTFKYNTTKYTANVDADVTSITVDAQPSNEKATIQSITGNENIVEGQNTIKVVVKAENGVTATYTIVVTKSAGGQEQVKESESETEEETAATSGIVINDVAYIISEDFTEDEILEDFSATTVSYQGVDYKGISFDKGNLVMLYLVPESGEGQGAFYVYDQNRGIFYPFVKIVYGDRYLIALQAPLDVTIPSNYTQADFTIDEVGTVTAYQQLAEDESAIPEFYVFYAMNSDGAEGWYQYDSAEQTFQRLNGTLEEDDTQSDDLERLQSEYNKLSDQLSKEKSHFRKIIGALIVLCVICVIVIVNLLLRGRGGHNRFEEDEEDFEEGEDELDGFEATVEEETAEDENPEDVQPKERKLSWREKRKNQKLEEEMFEEEDDFEDDFQDDFEEEPVVKKGVKKNTKPSESKEEEKDEIEVIDLNDL